MTWEVLTLPEFEDWLKDQGFEERQQIKAVIRSLAQDGPLLRRPIVGKIEGSVFSNMKELIPLGSNIRILFIFDPLRRAVLLHGGDKSVDFEGWYRKNLPIAEERYREFLEEEGLK